MAIKTFKELREVDALVGQMYKADGTLKDTKFGYAYKRFCDKYYLPFIEEFQNELADARIDNALEDEKTKAIIRDEKSPRGYAYSKEGERKVMQQERQINEKWNKKEINIEPFVSSHLPATLTEEQRESLTGILI